MLYRNLFLYFLFFIAVSLMSCSDSKDSSNASNAEIKFERVKSRRSGVDFNNEIKNSSELHIFNWNFLYQGAGVGLGDINNDGLADIFFCGNLVPDRLYLNKGNFKFEDITKSSGIIDDLWSTGVSMVDINNDGLLDIYVCKNNASDYDETRRNKLWVNQGKGLFVEKAKAYGLDDPGYSIQATFFDAEGDGDLDMYLVNQPIDRFVQMRANIPIQAEPYQDRLYINESGKYVPRNFPFLDQKPAYGLSATVSDFDDDGLSDIYVCNDYYHADYLLMNKGRLQFENDIANRMNHISFYSMGSDAADINNDGRMDLVTLDMAYGDHERSKTNMGSMDVKRFKDILEVEGQYQYMNNMLQLNLGSGQFSEIGQLADIAKTEWSWAPLFADLDNNGNKDLVISNGILHDIRNNDFQQRIRNEYNGVVDADNLETVLSWMKSTPINNQIFKNRGDLSFEEMKLNGFDDKGFSSGMAYADLDNDGDLDFVVNNSNEVAGIYENKSTTGNFVKIKLIGGERNVDGLGANIKLYQDGAVQSFDAQTTRGYMSSVQNIYHFGLGTETVIDSIVVTWNQLQKTVIYPKEVNKQIYVRFDEAKTIIKNLKDRPLFVEVNRLTHRHEGLNINEYKKQVLLPHSQNQRGPATVIADFNGDRLDDIFIAGDKSKSAGVYVQSKNGQLKLKENGGFELNPDRMGVSAIQTDFDKDGDLDLLIAELDESGDGFLNLWTNNGQAVFQKKVDFPKLKGNFSKILSADFNNDGWDDLFIAGRAVKDRYMEIPRSYLLINEGGIYQESGDRLGRSVAKLGMITDVISKDVDDDSDNDLMVVGEAQAPILCRNMGGEFFEIEDIRSSGESLTSWWWSLEMSDLDKDGKEDVLLGGLGANNKFHPSKDKPLMIFSDDFDQNESNDVFLAKKYKDRVVPVRGKECSSEQVPEINQRFENYQNFAEASIFEIIPQIDSSSAVSILDLKSFWLQNQGDGNYIRKEWPIEAQFGPIKDWIVKDLNLDGYPDIIFGGNHFGAEVETTRYDANPGGILFGSENGGFKFVDSEISGLKLLDDVRGLSMMKLGGVDHLVVASYNGPIRFFKWMGLKNKRRAVKRAN